MLRADGVRHMFGLKRKMQFIFLLLLLCMLAAGHSLAESPVSIRIETGREAYTAGDQALINLIIENTSDKPIYNVDIGHILPAGLQYAEKPDDSIIERIPARSSYTRSFLVEQSPKRMQVTVTADKEQYGDNEIAKLTVRVRNKLDRDVKNVSITLFLPEGLEYAQDQVSLVVDELAVNEMFEQVYYVARTFDGLVITIRADKDHYEDDEIAELTIRITNRANRLIKNVRIEHFLPNGLQYADKEEASLFDHLTIEPGETVEHVVRVRKMDTLPQTGDASVTCFMKYALLFAVSSMLILLGNKRRQRANEEGGI